VRERTVLTPDILISQNFRSIIFNLSVFPLTYLKYPNSLFCSQMGYAIGQFFKELVLQKQISSSQGTKMDFFSRGKKTLKLSK